ncbi:MAG TPA: NAD(P)H-dependent oxidoreductase subunit E, partial [Aggregatilineales bacterium]|nr:NAD(P)H-dependent oxidoreductase subunit E [Aggregatilineales bacterium]
MTDLSRYTNDAQAERSLPRLHVCMAAGCVSLRSDAVQTALEKEVTRQGAKCHVKGVGCMGLCTAGPLVAVKPDGPLYQNVNPDAAAEIVASMTSHTSVRRLEYPSESAFFKRQVKIVLENSGEIDPEHIEDYLAVGGYQGLMHVLSELTPAQVVAEVSRSGLRGRGGAGYPTGLKWGTVAKAAGPKKYVICNADEGDPGAFMDRSVLESDPHRVLEGMAIGAYAVGADEGFIYVRAEYPLAVKRLQVAIRQAE